MRKSRDSATPQIVRAKDAVKRLAWTGHCSRKGKCYPSPPPDQLNTFVLACQGDLATWQRKLENTHERLSRLPAPPDAPGITAAEYRPNTDEHDWSLPRHRSPDSGKSVGDGTNWQEPPKELAAAVFDPANPITTGMSLKEADASPLRSPNDTDSRVVTLHLHTLNQARTIGEFFREGTPLVLDLTEMTDDVADRIIHFSAGLIFGLRGSLERVMSKVFVLYPANVDIEVRNQAIADAHRLQARLTEAPKRQQQPSKAQIPQDLLPVIKVVGIGGGGVNAVSRMVEEERIGVQVIAVDTDALALRFSDADAKLEVGRELTRGHGGSANPEVGAQATEDHREEIEEALRGADMVFITAGEGGGTGTGGAPVVASVARTLGALTIGIVTRPFGFEGKHRSAQAEQGIERLRNEVDTLIVIPNDRLLTISHRQISVLDAFKAADQVLLSGIACVTDLITRPGLINLGFSAVKSVLSGGGLALMGTGSSRGDDRVVAAAEFASCSPLLEAGIDGARKVVLSVQGGSDLRLFEITEAAQHVSNLVAPEANIIIGALIDDALGDEVRVTVIATGLTEVDNASAYRANQ